MLLNCGVGEDSWTARKSNQSILKEISPEALILWPPDAKNGLIGKTLMLGRTEGRGRRGRLRKRWLDGITDSMDLSFEQAWGVGEGQGGLACCGPLGHKESDMAEQLD